MGKRLNEIACSVLISSFLFSGCGIFRYVGIGIGEGVIKGTNAEGLKIVGEGVGKGIIEGKKPKKYPAPTVEVPKDIYALIFASGKRYEEEKRLWDAEQAFRAIGAYKELEKLCVLYLFNIPPSPKNAYDVYVSLTEIEYEFRPVEKVAEELVGEGLLEEGKYNPSSKWYELFEQRKAAAGIE